MTRAVCAKRGGVPMLRGTAPGVACDLDTCLAHAEA